VLAIKGLRRSIAPLLTAQVNNPGQGLIAVAKCKRLENLGLTETQVTNAGLAHLHQLASLQNVWVTLGDRLTTRGASDLRRALPTTMVHIQQKGGNPKGKQQE